MIRPTVVLLALLAASDARADDESAFERGVERFQHEDFVAAVPLLEEAHAAAPDDADTALLLGIAYYRTEQLGRAKPLLEQAERVGDADDQASARVFLGLIADEQGHDQRARVYYEQVAHASAALGASARLLLDQAGPARWLVVGVVRPEYDSNVELLPDTNGNGHGHGMGGSAGDGDGELDLVLALSARPIERVPFLVDQTVAYDKQATLSDYDWLSDRVGATYVGVHGSARGALAYHFEASQLGRAKYQLAHVAEASARFGLRESLALGARYSLGIHDYGGDYSAYSGVTHTGLLQVIHGTRSTPVELAGGYEIEHEGTSDPSLTMLAQGPRGDLRWRAWNAGELRASLDAQQRHYDQRDDIYVAGEAALYVDLSNVVGLVLGASYIVDQSSDKTFGYTKWTAFAGLIFAISDT